MDAIELLKADHFRIRDLFDQLRKERGRQQKILLFENIQRNLEEYSFVEETVFYPVFRNVPELRELISESYQEHQEIKRLLREIRGLPDDSPALDAMIGKLDSAVEKHISEEEDNLYAEARRRIHRPEREQLGRHLQAAREERRIAA